MCRVSVITSVYNGERFIGETIDSIRAQTMKDWEHIIVDNCSTDRTVEIIEEYMKTDPRIRLIKNQENVGQIPNLNKAIELAKGEYIARSDADDISYPSRFEKQLAYMKEHPEAVLVGSEMDSWWDGTTKKYSGEHFFCDEKEIRFGTLFFCVMPNSSFFIRKKALTDHQIRYRDYQYAEDWAIIVDLLQAGSAYKFPESLIMYRIYGDQLTQKLPAELRIRETEEIMFRYLETQDIGERLIVEKAIRGELDGKKDLAKFEEVLGSYAKSSGVSGKSCVRKAYWQIMNWQRGSAALFFSYAKSPLREKGWLFSLGGLAFLKKCLMHYGKKRFCGGEDQ